MSASQRVTWVLLAAIAVAPSLLVIAVDGLHSNLLPRIAIPSVGFALFMGAVLLGRRRRGD